MISETAGACLVVGVACGIFPILRPRRAYKVSQRFAKIADSAWAAAKARNKTEDEVFLRFYAATVAYIMLTPMIASGHVPCPLDWSNSEKRTAKKAKATEEIKKYLDENAWLARYYAAGVLCYMSAVSLGYPLKVKHWGVYLKARLWIALASDADGGMRYEPKEELKEGYVERATKIEKWAEKPFHRPLAHA